MEPRPAWTDKPVPVEGNGINGFAGLFANREEGAMPPSDRQRGPDAARRWKSDGGFFRENFIRLKCTGRYLHREFGADHVSPVNNGYAADVS